MIVMCLRHFLIARAAVAEIMLLQDLRLFEQADRAVDRGDADMGIDLDGAAVDLLDIRMVMGVRQHPGDHPALLGHLQTPVDTDLLDA